MQRNYFRNVGIKSWIFYYRHFRNKIFCTMLLPRCRSRSLIYQFCGKTDCSYNLPFHATKWIFDRSINVPMKSTVDSKIYEVHSIEYRTHEKFFKSCNFSQRYHYKSSIFPMIDPHSMILFYLSEWLRYNPLRSFT